MLHSWAGCCSWMFPALCSWMVLKCHLVPGEQPGHGSNSVQPFSACRQGAREGLYSSSFPSFFSSGAPSQFCVLWGSAQPPGGMKAGGRLTSTAHSGRKSLLLLSTVLQNIILPPSIHPSMDPISQSHKEQYSTVSSVPAGGDNS